MKNSLIVNFFAAPGSGKSTMSAELFAKLKWNNINCELISEYAKDLVWESRQETLHDQLYLFGKQYHRMFRLNGKVDVIITDSPILLSLYYNSISNTASRLPASFDSFAIDVHHNFNNLNFFINRKKEYNPKGRNQSEAESDKIALDIKEMLEKNNIIYTSIDGTPDNVICILNQVKNLLNK